jgi:hypothetical protein
MVALSMAYGADEELRARLLGAWQEQGSTPGVRWTFEESSKGLKITHSDASQKAITLDCNTMGRECTASGAGGKAKISMWYNGPKLVQMETRGSDVVRRRFSVAGDGQTLEVELTPISPAGKAETLRLKRVELSAVAGQSGGSLESGATKR